MTTASDWQTRVGSTWAEEWFRTDRSFAGLSRHLDAAILAAAPSGPFKAVDIGCGAGQTCIALADARPDADITGLDLSPELIFAARDRAGDRSHLRFVEGDAIALAGTFAPIDLLFSRHGVMFFDDPVAAFANLFAATASGGASVFSCFRKVEENPWATEVAAAAGGDPLTDPAQTSAGPGPFALGDPARVHDVLGEAGWSDIALQSVDYSYVAGAGDDPVADAVGFFKRIGPAARALADVPKAERPAALDRMAKVCARHQVGDTIEFPAAAWIVTARKR